MEKGRRHVGLSWLEEDRAGGALLAHSLQALPARQSSPLVAQWETATGDCA